MLASDVANRPRWRGSPPSSRSGSWSSSTRARAGRGGCATRPARPSL